MRMWMIDPRLLCRQHLLGEHVELHMLVGHLKKGRRLGKLAHSRFVEPRKMWVRHDEIAAEMVRRGYRHESPYDGSEPLLAHLDPFERTATVDPARSVADLKARCPECREEMELSATSND